MKKIIVFSILLLSAIAVTVGTTITTTIQIQPAYSQAQHCSGIIIRNCVTPGQDPTTQDCFGPFCLPSTPIGGDNPHKEAGQLIRDCHSGSAECTVRPP